MTDQELYDALSPFVSENKRAHFERVTAERTRHVTVVLEDVQHSQNASAVVRTCDLVGVQDVHAIEGHGAFELDRGVTLGSAKWVDAHRHRGHADNTSACVAELRAKGYRIIATSPRDGGTTPGGIDLHRPMAFCFGTELTGLSATLLDSADEHLRIPMHGFTESYNLSVSAAITLFTVMERLRASDIAWRLDEQERIALKLRWARKVVRGAKGIEARLPDGRGAV